MELLQLHNACKSFGKKLVVKDVAFEIEKGSILGLFGRNGSGKSTLLKMIFGTLKADAISVSIDGNIINPKDVIRKQLIAYGPQHGFLPKNVKVRDVIPIFHTSEAAQDAIFYDAHIATMTYKKVGALSLGELKYFEVLLLSQLPHPFMMLDEPFSMLEPLHKEQLKSVLTHLKNKKGIIITDHYYEDVLSISDNNILIKEGVSYNIQTKTELRDLGYLSTMRSKQ